MPITNTTTVKAEGTTKTCYLLRGFQLKDSTLCLTFPTLLSYRGK